MLSPSWIHRSDDLVGIVTPTSEPEPGPASTVRSTVLVDEPQALSAAVSARAPPIAAKRVNFIVPSRSSERSVVGRPPARAHHHGAFGESLDDVAESDRVRAPGNRSP